MTPKILYLFYYISIYYNYSLRYTHDNSILLFNFCNKIAFLSHYGHYYQLLDIPKGSSHDNLQACQVNFKFCSKSQLIMNFTTQISAFH